MKWTNSMPKTSLAEKWAPKLISKVAPVVRQYSSLTVLGVEHFGNLKGGAILACNHSGGLWWDALCLLAGVDEVKDESEPPLSFIAHHWDAKISALRALLKAADCYFLDENAAHISETSEVCQGLAAGKRLCLFPEESYHSYRDRYTLFQFSPHVIAYARAANVPIIPTAVIGVEEAAPVYGGPKVSDVPLHIPIHPPFIFPKPVTIEFGAPVMAGSLLKGHGDDSKAAELLQGVLANLIGQYRDVKVSNRPYIAERRWF